MVTLLQEMLKDYVSIENNAELTALKILPKTPPLQCRKAEDWLGKASNRDILFHRMSHWEFFEGRIELICGSEASFLGC